MTLVDANQCITGHPKTTGHDIMRAASRAALILGLVLCGLMQTSVQTFACRAPIDLAAINRELAKPGLASDLSDRARKLKAKAAAEIESGHPAEGQRSYYELMTLLGIPTSAGQFRC